MERYTLDLPAMYGDHHVTEVRRLLLELPGVQDVYASSAFHYVEVLYDPAKIHSDNFTARLEQAGYLGELAMPREAGAVAAHPGDAKRFMRHTAVFENLKSSVSFTQTIGYTGRPLWPCPGIGPIRTDSMEEE